MMLTKFISILTTGIVVVFFIGLIGGFLLFAYSIAVVAYEELVKSWISQENKISIFRRIAYMVVSVVLGLLIALIGFS